MTIPRHVRALLGVVLSLLFVLALTACGDDDDSTTETGGDAGTDTTAVAAADCDAIDAVGAFVRLPPDDNTAVYVELTNNGEADTALVGASADFAETWELHEMVTGEDGVMEMQPVEGQSIALPVGQTVALEPGGLHVMAIGVTDELAEGDVVPVTLEFEGGCTITVDAEVRAVDEGMDMGGDMSGDMSSDMGGEHEHSTDGEHEHSEG